MTATKPRPIQRRLIPAPNGDPRLLEPGWPGQLADDELAFIWAELFRDPKLARRWGFRPGQKTRPEDAIRRLAMDGDPDKRRGNVTLARPRKRVLFATLAVLSKLRT